VAPPGVKLPKLPPGRTGFLTEAQYRQVMTTAADWMRAPIALAVSTGMRRSELLGLRWADVNFQSRQIILRATKNGDRRALYLRSAGVRATALCWILQRPKLTFASPTSGAKCALRPGFPIRGTTHGRVCGFLEGKPHEVR
jgi:integrase